jgi:hypothetical protein
LPTLLTKRVLDEWAVVPEGNKALETVPWSKYNRKLARVVWNVNLLQLIDLGKFPILGRA